MGACLDLDVLQSNLGPDTGAPVDAGVAGLMDSGAMSDDASARLDLAPDLSAPTSGCADGKGSNVGANAPFAVWTCPGVFTAGGLASRCASGFVVCRAISIGDVVCDGIPRGQFIGRKGYRQPGPFPPDGSQASYTWDGGGTQQRGIMYCGQLAGGYDAPAGAGGFFRVVQCDSGGSPNVSSYSCPISAASDADFDLVANSNPSNGVLCCPAGSQ